MNTLSAPYAERQGYVVKKTRGTYFVDIDDRVVPCSLSAKLRKQLVYPTADPHSVRRAVQDVREISVTDPVAINDYVRLLETDDGVGLILSVAPRRNKFSRLAAGPKPLEQVIVANLDQVLPVMAAARPAPKWHLLDRYLVSAESLGLPVLICITKLDLAPDVTDLVEIAEYYRRIGYRVVLTSAITETGLLELRDFLGDRISVFIGKSGVGKTSLLNALQPELGLRVQAVSSATDKGRHTTTHLELFPLVDGGSVLDTPGMREFGLWELDKDPALLAQLFPEMRSLVGVCRFGLGCCHHNEPGCAIKEAVTSGEIKAHRYQSFLKLRGA